MKTRGSWPGIHRERKKRHGGEFLIADFLFPIGFPNWQLKVGIRDLGHIPGFLCALCVGMSFVSGPEKLRQHCRTDGNGGTIRASWCS